MRAFTCCALGGALISLSALAAPELPGPAFPRYADAAALNAACDSGLAGANARVETLENHAPDRGWLAAWDDLDGYIEDASGPVYLLENVHPDQAMRDAAQACTLRWADFGSTLGQNESLYRAARALQPAGDIDRELAKKILEKFEDAGVGLPPDGRARAKALNDRIADLAQRFAKNIRDADVKLAFRTDELAGVPDAVWKTLPRDAEGRVLLGMDYPTYGPVVQLAESEMTRKRMWRAKQDEGGVANLKLLDEIARLRRDYAALFSFDSFDAFQLRRTMVETPANADRFLASVKDAVVEREKRDIEELRRAKAAHLATPLRRTLLHHWDVAFYTERLRRERYAVDQEAFRAYFPPEESLEFVMKIAEKMLGVKHTRVSAQLWSPDVRAYAVSDTKTGALMATLYVDLYPREGKYNHAAVWPIRGGATRNGRAPQSALVVNMDRKGLTLDELETLLHEMGHALHNDLSATRYSSQAGINVKADFGEAPSQMLEDWVYDKRVLKLFAEVCPRCQPVPDELIDKARVARDYGKGLRTARQLLYASYDLALYAADPVEPMALWARMEGQTPLGYVPGTMFPAGFEHIASNYAAGYYGYLWSLVIALDLRTAFAAARLDPVVGARYRADVLSQGGQHPPRELLRNFLGRETNAKAFFDDLARGAGGTAAGKSTASRAATPGS
ncbi:MAG: M3 family metallopeptidase [Caldimonas sp.]